MDFGSWTNRLKDVTTVSLPFKGLDEMAAEDEYVHSKDLNVKQQQNVFQGSNSSSRRESRPEPLHNSNNTTRTTTTSSNWSNSLSRTLSLPTDTNQEEQGGNAAQTGDRNNNQGYRRANSSGPPAFTRSSFGVLEMESEFSDSSVTEGDGGLMGKNQKKQHRFMEDLDNRLSKKNIPTKSSVTATFSSSSKGDSGNDWNSKGSWLFGFGGANNNMEQKPSSQTNDGDCGDDEDNGEGTKDTLPLLSRQRIFPKSKPKTNNNEKNNNEPVYSVVTSSGMLNADDLMALEQMRHLNESRDSEGIIVRIKEIIQSHPRETFITFTLCLSVGVYFYRRHISNEDDVN